MKISKKKYKKTISENEKLRKQLKEERAHRIKLMSKFSDLKGKLIYDIKNAQLDENNKYYHRSVGSK